MDASTLGASTLGIALLAYLLVGLAAHRFRDEPRVLWTMAWVSVLATGSAAVFGAPAVAGGVVPLLGPLFPVCQLAGAFAFVRGRAPAWIVPLGLSLGVARAVAPQWGAEWLAAFIASLIEPAGTLAAVAVLAVGAERAQRGRRLAFMMLLLTCAGIADAFAAREWASGTGVTATLGVLWIALAALGVPLQLQTAAQRRLRDQELLSRRTQAELVLSRERFRALTESCFDLVAELDADERFTYVSPRYEELLGHPRESFLGRTPFDFLYEQDVPKAAAFAMEAELSGKASGLVVRARHRDGSHRWLESVARAFRSADGERRWVMNSREVSDRIESERAQESRREHLEEAVSSRTAALHESEARFRALADHAPELISEFDGRGRYTFANASFRHLLGRDPESLLGRHPNELLHPDDLADSAAGMRRALRERGAAHALHRLSHADGSWRWFDNTGRAYRSAAGELRFVSIGRDVTEARRSEQERRQLEAQMQEVQRQESLGVLAGGIAHDFNNLLAVILGNVALLEDERGSDLETRLARIRAAAGHAEGLTRQMLAYAGKSVAELLPLELSELAFDTADLLRASISKKCSLVLELEEGLPPVDADATQLRQVLVNLVLNASEALGDRGGEIWLRTGYSEVSEGEIDPVRDAPRPQAGRWVHLEVEDGGPGMEAELQRRVFEPFYSTKRSGRGLGLAAVLGIARAHSGLLDVDTEPGRGTRFRLRLPPSSGRHRASLEAPARERPAQEARSAARVLVVDDEDAVREVAQALLERAGMQVEVASGGREALRRLLEGAPVDAVLLDLAMPDLSGSEVLAGLRQAGSKVPVVISSGYREELAAEKLGGGAVFGFVQKPYEPDQLVAALRGALHSAPPEAERLG